MDNSILHKNYVEYAPLVKMVHDSMRDDLIKANKEIHLPIPGAIASRMQNTATVAGAKATYKALAEGGMLPSVVSEALNEYIGVFFTNELSIPEGEEERKVTNTGLTITGLIRNVTKSVLTDGRRVLVVDKTTEDGTPYITEYSSIKLENWDTDKDGNLTLAKFNEGEIIEEPNEGKTKYRVYEMIDRLVTQAVYHDNDIISEVVIPLNYIPVFPIGSIDCTPEWDEIPLLKQAVIMRQYYRVSCYYYRAIDKANDYTVAVAGVTEDEAKAMVAQGVGNGAFWWSENTEAKYQYLEVLAKGIAAAKAELDELEKKAKEFGIQFTAGANEAAETVRMRKEAKLMSISTVSHSCGAGVTKALVALGELDAREFIGEVKINLPSTDPILTLEGIKASKIWADAGYMLDEVAYINQKKMGYFDGTGIKTLEDYRAALQKQNEEPDQP